MVGDGYWSYGGGGAHKPTHFETFDPLLYGGTIVLLVVVLVIGKEINGSRRWLDLGFASMQPSEGAKIAIILALAAWFHRVSRPDGYTLRDLVPVGAILGLPMFLVLQEPDLGHTLMLFFIGGSMLLYEKFDQRALITLVVAGVIGVPIVWNFVLRDYQKNRVLTLLDRQGAIHGTGWHARRLE